MRLSEEQLGPVLSDAHLNACSSVPGSGKTTVLTERAKRLRRKGDAVLAVTFSRRAAGELSRRLRDPGVRVGTLHSLCLEVVSEHWALLGSLVATGTWPERPVVLDRAAELRVIREEVPGATPPEHLASVFTRLRDLGCEPQTALAMAGRGVYLGKPDEIKLWARFQRRKLATGRLGYDDFVYAADILLPLPAVSTHLCGRWDHVLVDEAQDTSEAQWRILRPIVASAKTSMAVGDLNQAIYGWRNADGTVLRRLQELGPCKSFHLTKSYRVRGVVAKFLNLVCPDRRTEIDPASAGGDVKLKAYDTREEEVTSVCSSVQQGDAILARTNAYLEPFQKELARRRVPYWMVGDEPKPGVAVSTGHAAKGLEWRRVFVVGASVGRIPHPRSDSREEERLFYVMLSRGQDEVIISFTGQPSPLIPTEYVKAE